MWLSVCHKFTFFAQCCRADNEKLAYADERRSGIASLEEMITTLSYCLHSQAALSL